MLEKSEEPSEEQISEACKILNIGLEAPWTTVAQSSDPPHSVVVAFDPRHEWTMKWLLKEFHTGAYPGSLCLLPGAWVLLGSLVAHTHPSKVARILTSNKFTEILRKSLTWLCENAGHMMPSSTTEVSSDDGSEVSRNTKQISRKRKRREEGEAVTHKEALIDIDWASTLFAAICGSFRRLQALATYQSSHGDPIVAEQLKYAIRSIPIEAATILGSCCYFLNHVLQRQKPVRSKANGCVEDIAKLPSGVTIRLCAAPFMDFWETHALSHGVGTGLAVSVSLVPMSVGRRNILTAHQCSKLSSRTVCFPVSISPIHAERS